MKAVKFPEMNTIWAKNQPQYNELPAHVTEQETISCWALTWRERWKVLVGGRLWLHQLNFGKPLQPQLITVDSPFAMTDEINLYSSPGTEVVL